MLLRRSYHLLQSLALPSLGELVGVWLCVALPWLLTWTFLSPLGGWPLNDDPFYAKPLQFWSEQGEWQWVRQYGALTASSAAHVGAGALAVVGQDFDYRRLFLVCIIQQTFGATALYFAARVLKAPTSFAWLAALSLSTFPLYFGHGFTFMTDGPATAWGALACTCAVCGIVRGDWRWLCAASIATGWGYWMRQTNGLLLLAPVIALGLLRLQRRWDSDRPAEHFGKSARAGLTQFSALLIAACAAIAVLESGRWFPSSFSRIDDIAPTVEEGYLYRATIAVYGWWLLSGWFALPWLVVLVQEARRAIGSMSPRAARLCLACAAAGMLFGAIPFVSTSGRAHLTSATGTFIQNAHFGPIFLSDMDQPGRWGALGGVTWPSWVWQSLSVLALISCGCLAWWGTCTVVAWIQAASAGERDSRSAVALGLAVMVLAAVLVIAGFVEPHMDRYWMFLLPALAMWWLALASLRKWQLSRPAMAWAAVWLVAQLAVAIIFTHDMLAWNDARWRYVNEQLAAGVPAEALDAGRDVNAWLRMDEDVDTSARPGDTSPWWSGRATTAVAVGSRPGWHQVERLPWQAWATGETHHLLVLERDVVSSIAVDQSLSSKVRP